MGNPFEDLRQAVVVRPMNSPGPQGAAAPEMKVQYSNDGSSWHNDPVETDRYLRFSTDNSVSWSDAVYFNNLAETLEWVEKARQWAENPENTPVEDDKYSALHHALQAKKSEITAGEYAIDAAESAVEAFGAAAPAWDSETVYSYNDVVSFDNGHTYRCIGDNVTTPPNTDGVDDEINWTRITVAPEGFFEYDTNYDFQPVIAPVAKTGPWMLDELGDIQPRLDPDLAVSELDELISEAVSEVAQSAGDEITLRSLIASAGSTPMSITVYDDIPITDDLIVPENIELNVKLGGILSVSATKTLTINGPFSAGLYQVFSGDGEVIGSPKIDAVYPEWFGATASSGIDLALKKAHKLNAPIQITQIYDLDNNTSVEILSDLYLYGSNPDSCGFRAINDTVNHLFTRSNHDEVNVKFENVSFVNTSTATPSVILPSNGTEYTGYLNKLEFYNCYFEGGWRCYDLFNTTLDYNPDTDEPIGVGTFIFNNNELKNITATFCRINSCINYYTYIKNNKVTNFDYSLFYAGINNDSPHIDALYRHRIQWTVDGNEVLCDTDYIPVAETDGLGLYYVFCLVEGYADTFYTNNRVEGMHEKLGRVVYDIYHSGPNILYSNNIWRNNLSEITDINDMGSILIKSKGDSGSAEGGGNRIYKDSVFEFTNEWLDKKGLSRSQAKAQFMDIGLCHLFVENNTILIPSFKVFTSNEEVLSFHINNNTIEADEIYNGNRWFSFKCESGSDEICSISNNNITLKGGITSPVFWRSLSSGYFKEVSIKNNYLYSDASDSGQIFYEIISNVNGREYIEGNTFIVNNMASVCLGSLGRIKAENNHFENIDGQLLKINVNNLYSDSCFNATYSGGFRSGFFEHRFYSDTTQIMPDQVVFIEMEIYTSLGYNHIVIKYEISYDAVANNYKITFVDDSDITHSFYYNDASTSGVYMKKIVSEGFGTNNLNFYVDGSTRILSLNGPSERCKVKCSVMSIPKS